MKATSIAKEFLTTEQLAARWHRQERGICDDIRRGDLIASKIGGRWLVDLSDVIAFEQARTNVQRTSRRTRRPRARKVA